MRRPRRISPAARARRALLVDVLLGLAIATAALIATAGLGVVAFFGVPLLLALLLWAGAERMVRRLRRRRPRAG